MYVYAVVNDNLFYIEKRINNCWALLHAKKSEFI